MYQNVEGRLISKSAMEFRSKRSKKWRIGNEVPILNEKNRPIKGQKGVVVGRIWKTPEGTVKHDVTVVKITPQENKTVFKCNNNVAHAAPKHICVGRTSQPRK